MKQPGALDASFLHSENERVANHIGGLYIYDQSTVPGGETIPDPEFCMSCFRDSFDELRAAMLPKPSPRARPAGRKKAA